MKITVVGKEHRAGKSKTTGREYDKNVVHYLTRAQGVDGQRGDSAWLDSAFFPLSDIIVGETYIVDFDGRGFVQDFYPAEG